MHTTPAAHSSPTAAAGNQKPKLWQQSVSSVANAAGPPVVRIIYNPNFNEVGWAFASRPCHAVFS